MPGFVEKKYSYRIFPAIKERIKKQAIGSSYMGEDIITR